DVVAVVARADGAVVTARGAVVTFALVAVVIAGLAVVIAGLAVVVAGVPVVVARLAVVLAAVGPAVLGALALVVARRAGAHPLALAVDAGRPVRLGEGGRPADHQRRRQGRHHRHALGLPRCHGNPLSRLPERSGLRFPLARRRSMTS